jgi:hypothetical protein
MNDLSHSRPINLEEWSKRPVIEKTKESFARW